VWFDALVVPTRRRRRRVYHGIAAPTHSEILEWTATDPDRWHRWQMTISRAVDRDMGLFWFLWFAGWLCRPRRLIAVHDDGLAEPADPLDTRLPVFACAP
jgi:hypothetical protein